MAPRIPIPGLDRPPCLAFSSGLGLGPVNPNCETLQFRAEVLGFRDFGFWSLGFRVYVLELGV